MNFFIALLALAAFAMATPEAGLNLEARVGCSQKGEYCNGDGTFRCCVGQGKCSGNVIWPNMIADD
ncbi:hypothetical protein N7447_006999 [Penicillium robsamsonii]|uniref:uncharacterized protein n=1 Tax=Penicillium robsamsonii TaxID=1792511 RepID=UPI0025486FD6|nr:uncharacterized protein N7447_006999 [Penicillium robsamsonii]KAJ5824659.1 hypothetical protein N7447_006999 [Penicillium robsamsonii]